MKGSFTNSISPSLHWFNPTGDTGILELALGACPWIKRVRLICKLPTGLEAKLGDGAATKPIPASTCGRLPCPGSSSAPERAPSPSVASRTVSPAAALPAPVALAGFGRVKWGGSWSDYSSSVLKVAQMKNKQTNLVSFMFLLSVQKCSC